MSAKKKVCVSCGGVEWVDGKGWVGEHDALCPNDRHAWRYTRDADDEGKPIVLAPDKEAKPYVYFYSLGVFAQDGRLVSTLYGGYETDKLISSEAEMEDVITECLKKGPDIFTGVKFAYGNMLSFSRVN